MSGRIDHNRPFVGILFIRNFCATVDCVPNCSFNIINSKIKLGYGTDFVSVHNNFESGWEYYCWMVNGMDPFRALQAASKNNAEICEVDHLVGTIEPGKLADIAGWGRDLLKDPHALRDCAFVMKEGEVYPAKSHIFDCYKI